MWRKHKRKILAHAASALAASLIMLGLAAGLVWWKRAEIFHYFASQFLSQTHVVDVVKQANPAVFSIVISKDVPIVEQYMEEWNPFQDFFGGDFGGFQIPRYREKGTERREVGSGTGFLVTAGGLALTNKHVVEDEAASYTALANNGKKYDVEVVAKDPVLDLAVVRLKGEAKFPYLTLGNSDSLDVGETAIAIGNALGEFRNTVSVGVISGLARSITASDASGKSETLEEVIQTDAAINPGNSGGPLLSLSVTVVGINVAVAQGSQNIGFAIPVNLIKKALQSVEEYGRMAN